MFLLESYIVEEDRPVIGIHCIFSQLWTHWDIGTIFTVRIINALYNNVALK